MLKKISILSLFIVLLLTGFLIYGKSKKEVTKILGSDNSTSITIPTSKNDIPNPVEITYNEQDFSVAWYKLEPVENLILIPNYNLKLTSTEAAEKYNCKFLGSAGFYSKEGKPLGLVVADGQKVNSWQKNSLLNGVFSVNRLLTPRITRDEPKDLLALAVQSGPLIKENAAYQTVDQGNDNSDRRMLLATTGENKAIYLAIYNRNSVLLGPKLSDLPEIIKVFERRLGIIFADVINLDGGSASAYSTEDFKLPEVANVGSFFCLKD
jgi:hypothetical protein